MDKHNTYESTVIINASLDDAQVESVVTRISETITKNGGSITALNKWGRKRLAYSINKKTNGFYVNFEFTAPSSSIALLERSYQLDEMILRYLTIALDAKALAAKKATAAPPPAVETAAPVQPREPLFTESAEKK
ncbi:MAG: 30S ribosomal protein S6 [Ignavibacteriae bacterium]|nr:30S ribosomal protein S6 [Ignavibacteriota bacterium]